LKKKAKGVVAHERGRDPVTGNNFAKKSERREITKEEKVCRTVEGEETCFELPEAEEISQRTRRKGKCERTFEQNTPGGRKAAT